MKWTFSYLSGSVDLMKIYLPMIQVYLLRQFFEAMTHPSITYTIPYRADELALRKDAD